MVEEGKPAPTFTLPSDSGEDVSLESFRGRSVVSTSIPRTTRSQVIAVRRHCNERGTRMRIVNLYGDDWDATRDREGWHAKGVLVGERIGGELLGATLSEVEPGSKLWPYHTHYLNEEWVIVLRGEPTLRTPEGEQILKEGDVVCFPRGKKGAHQIINRSDSPVRVLMLSSMTS